MVLVSRGAENVCMCVYGVWTSRTLRDYFCGGYVGLARTVYMHRILDYSPANNTVYMLYIYGSGQP
jgi:hypothetical protein